MHLRSADFNAFSIFYIPNSEDIKELLNQFQIDSVGQLEGKVVEILKKDVQIVAGFKVKQNLLATVSQ